MCVKGSLRQIYRSLEANSRGHLTNRIAKSVQTRFIHGRSVLSPIGSYALKLIGNEILLLGLHYPRDFESATRKQLELCYDNLEKEIDFV